MKTRVTIPAVALSLLLASTAVPLLLTQPAPAFAKSDKSDKKEKQQTVSPKIMKDIKEIDDLLKQNKLPDALAKAQEAQNMSGKTPYETTIVDDYLGRIYLEQQNYPKAAEAFDDAYQTGAMPEDSKASRLKITTQLYLQSQNYPKAIDFAKIYEKEVGQDPEMTGLLGEAEYMNKDPKDAIDTLNEAVSEAQAKNVPVKEEWLHYLEHAQADQGNMAGVISAEEMVVEKFPSKEAWTSLLTNVFNSSKGSDKVTLDIYRLMLRTGVMSNPNDFTDMANLDLQQELPGEARDVLEKGFAGGFLGKGSQKAAQDQLLARAKKAVAEDQKSIARGTQEAKSRPTGDAEVKFGEAYWSYGDNDKAIDLIKDGLSKGVKNADDAKLQLAMAYFSAGNRDQALDTLKGVTSNSPTGQIARLWTIYINSPPTA